MLRKVYIIFSSFKSNLVLKITLKQLDSKKTIFVGILFLDKVAASDSLDMYSRLVNEEKLSVVSVSGSLISVSGSESRLEKYSASARYSENFFIKLTK